MTQYIIRDTLENLHYLMWVGKASVEAISNPFQPDINMKLKTASKTITPALLLRNQMKNADTDDKAIDMPVK